jgi:hypothetical protein
VGEPVGHIPTGSDVVVAPIDDPHVRKDAQTGVVVEVFEPDAGALLFGNGRLRMEREESSSPCAPQAPRLGRVSVLAHLCVQGCHRPFPLEEL